MKGNVRFVYLWLAKEPGASGAGHELSGVQPVGNGVGMMMCQQLADNLPFNKTEWGLSAEDNGYQVERILVTLLT